MPTLIIARLLQSAIFYKTIITGVALMDSISMLYKIPYIINTNKQKLVGSNTVKSTKQYM